MLQAVQAEPPAAPLEGVVLDPARMPVRGVRVTAVREGRSLGVSAISGADGRFSLQLAPGLYGLQVFADGFRNEERRLEVRDTAPVSPIEVVLQLAEHRELVTVTETAGYQTLATAATKTPTLLQDVPQAISVVGSDLIRDQSMRNMADVVRYMPGITMAQGEGHRDAPVIRGNITTADFYLDGVRDDVQYLRDLYNAEQVEAIKGANALTFGRGGGGGVINRVTKSANFFPVQEVELQGGTFGNRRITSDFGRSWGSRLGLRFNGLYENSDSFRHDVNLERYGLAPSMVFQAAERTQLRVRYEHFHDGRTVDRGIPSFAGRPSGAHRSTFFGDPRLSNAEANVHLGSATLEHQAGAWNFRNATVIGDYDKFYQNIFPGSVNASQTLVSISGYNNATVRRNLFNQTDATAILGTGRFRHTILVGAEFGRQRSDNFRNTAFFNNATSFSAPFLSPNVSTSPVFRQSASDADNRPIARIAAVFLQDQVELTRHVQFVAGVRYDYFDMDFRNNRNSQSLSRTDNMVSPRLGLVVKPVEQLSLYGSYSVAYLPSSGDQFASLSATTQTLRPEKFNNYEAGAKWNLNRRLAVTTAFYRLDRDNTTAPDPNVPGRIVQTGSQRTNGFEIGVNGSVTSRWTVAGGYAAQDAFINSTTTAAPAGAKVALVPRHSVSLWNNYRILPRWSMGLGIIRQDDMFTGIDNRVVLPAFTRVDLAQFFSLTEMVRLQANVENLFDNTYHPTAHNNNNILPGSALAVRVGLVARF